MLKTSRFLIALAVALVLMLLFRALVFSICVIRGNALTPLFHKGDRVLVNRWSYGLRVGGEGKLLPYTRVGRRKVEANDIVAFDHPNGSGEMMIARCAAIPGDTITTADGKAMRVPGRNSCEPYDYYWMKALNPNDSLDSRVLGLVSEEFIIGRATVIVYSHDPDEPLWRGWRTDATLVNI